jgi:integrase
MAYIRSYDTKQKRKGKTVKRYEVVWRETMGGHTRSRQESYPTRELAEARRDELNAAKHTLGGTSALANAKVKATRSFGAYAADWLTAQQLKVDNGRIKPSTYNAYAGYLSRYALKTFGAVPIGTITRADCEGYLAGLGGKARATRRLALQVLSGVLEYAVADGALPGNPARSVSRSAVPTATQPREHRPLTAPELATLAAHLATRHGEIDELLLLTLCYTGLRKTEAQGLELRDVTLTTGPANTVTGAIRVQRTKTRQTAQGGTEWLGSTPKTKRSTRTVPLPPWLAAKMLAYTQHTHGDSANPLAPVWPRRVRGAYPRGPHQPHTPRRPAVTFDYSAPMDLDGWAKRVLRPALKAVGAEGVRLHDLRHTFAALQLSAGVHFMQVAQWLGHASYVLTLNTYGEWLPEQVAANTLPAPATNVVPLRAAQG